MLKDTALILAGHGSTKNKDSSRHTRETAKRLQKRGIFKEVRAGFWKESPSFQEVFQGLEAKDAIVVPWFLTRGYFVEKVLSEQFAATPIPTRIVDPIGARPEVLQLMKKRAEKLARSQLKFKFKLKRAIEGLLRFSKPEEDGNRWWKVEGGRWKGNFFASTGVPVEETSLLLASHGTPLHKGSRVAADTLAEELAKDGYRVSRAMFLEEEPKIADWRKLAAGSGKGIKGEDAFTLYDTYGFPLDLTQLLARERGIGVDAEGFEKAMEGQRQRARQSQSKTTIKVEEEKGPDFPTVFTGYEKTEEPKVEKVVAEALKEPGPAGAKGRVFLSPTPFYGEMGGQVGDTGWIEWDGNKVRVVATVRGAGGVTVHLTETVVAGKGPVRVKVDLERRGRIEGHHTATHLLHWALRNVLGTGVRQKGSYVGPDRLRFDFAHLQAMTPEEVAQVERQVNEKVLADVPVKWEEREFAKVKDDPTVLQFFGDKYGATVRVVDIGGFSKELCGGTHVRSCGKIGAVRVVGESAIAAGVRRIEGLIVPGKQIGRAHV